jgi:hypothetical protein
VVRVIYAQVTMRKDRFIIAKTQFVTKETVHYSIFECRKCCMKQLGARWQFVANYATSFQVTAVDAILA